MPSGPLRRFRRHCFPIIPTSSNHPILCLAFHKGVNVRQQYIKQPVQSLAARPRGMRRNNQIGQACIQQGIAALGGSSVKTSTPAPPICPYLSAASSAFSSTSPPRPQLIKTAPGFICRNSFSPIIFSVWAFSGQCSDNTSAVCTASSKET